jgi:Arc/MetJ-type ribon-helix-helix transcriptional regulator
MQHVATMSPAEERLARLVDAVVQRTGVTLSGQYMPRSDVIKALLTDVRVTRAMDDELLDALRQLDAEMKAVAQQME